MKALRRLAFLILAGAGLCLGVVWQWSNQPRSPNLLLITLDTTRADRLGCYGDANGNTPVLDTLAENACVFERAYAPVPLTLPSHASLMTGLYPPEHGVRVNNGRHRLGPDVPVLAERLRKRGYQTGAFLGAFVLDHKFGLDRGFDIYDDTMDEDRNPFLGDGHNHQVRSGQRVVDAALGWLKGTGRKPFFCWVHLFDPHTPYNARPELFGERFRDRPYDAGIAYVDLQTGRLLDFLRQSGRDSRTIVVVLGDHGESLGEHQERTHGYTLYNATLHVPLMIRWAGDAAPVRSIAAPVSLVDLFPTLDAALNPSLDVACSGHDLWPICKGEDASVREYYAESDHPLEEGGAAPLRAIVTTRWKYIRSPKPELYDLAADPREEQNLAETEPEKLDELEHQLQNQESTFALYSVESIDLSLAESRKLSGLGYIGGGPVEFSSDAERPDIKDLLPQINAFSDAQLLLGVGRFTQAALILEQVVREAPSYAQAWYYLGVCRHELHQSAAAVDAFEHSLTINDQRSSRNTNRGKQGLPFAKSTGEGSASPGKCRGG